MANKLILRERSKSCWMKLHSKFCCAATPVHQAPDKIETSCQAAHFWQYHEHLLLELAAQKEQNKNHDANNQFCSKERDI